MITKWISITSCCETGMDYCVHHVYCGANTTVHTVATTMSQPSMAPTIPRPNEHCVALDHSLTHTHTHSHTHTHTHTHYRITQLAYRDAAAITEHKHNRHG